MCETSPHDTALPPLMLDTSSWDCTCTRRERKYYLLSTTTTTTTTSNTTTTSTTSTTTTSRRSQTEIFSTFLCSANIQRILVVQDVHDHVSLPSSQLFLVSRQMVRRFQGKRIALLYAYKDRMNVRILCLVRMNVLILCRVRMNVLILCRVPMNVLYLRSSVYQKPDTLLMVIVLLAHFKGGSKP